MSGYDVRAVRALVADSTHHASELLAGMLHIVGFRQLKLADSAGAFAQDICSGGFDIAFLGERHDAPGGAGPVRRIRAKEARDGLHTPIVMLFSDATQRSIVMARDAGVTDFIRKPVSPAILALRIEQVLTRPRPVVASASYNGPDRRRRTGSYKGGERRGGAG